MNARRLLFFIPILVAPNLSGCFLFESSDDTSSEETAQTPSPSLRYATDKLRFLRTLEITPIAPVLIEIDTRAEFRIAPLLPPNLAFDETDGTLSGTPDVVSPATFYTVSAVLLRNAGVDGEGEPIVVEILLASTTLCIEVLETEGPTSVRYTLNPVAYNTGVDIVPNVPTVEGLATLFETDVPLPSGLSLSSTTGVLTGRPTDVTPAADYVVTASNPFGSAQTTLRIEILGPFDASSLLTLNLDSTFSSIRLRPARRFSHRTFRSTPANPISSAVTPDGRFLFLSCADNTLVRFEQAAGVARPDRGTVVGQYPFANEMLIDGAGERLLLLSPGTLRSIQLRPDGTLGSEESLALNDSPFAMARNPASDLVYVLKSGISLISTYRLRPSLAPAAADVAVPGYAGAVEVTADGSALFIANVIGNSVVAYRTVPGAGSGEPPLVLRQQVGLDGVPRDLESARGLLFVARDGAATGLLSLRIGADASLSDPRAYAPGAGYTSLTTVPGGRELYALDPVAREAAVFDISGGTAFLDHRIRTRSTAFELRALPGPKVFSRTRWVLAAEPAAASLGALEIEYGAGTFTPAAAGPVPTGSDPTAVAMNEAETDVWVTNRADDTLSRYAFDATDGALTALGQVPTRDGPLRMALDRSERFLFVLHGNEDSLQRFDVGPGGSLTPGPVTTSFAAPLTQLGFDPTGQFLYVLDESGAITPFVMNPTTGSLTERAPVQAGAGLRDLDFAITGRHLYASSDLGELFQFAIDAQNGDLSALSPPSIPTGLGSGSLAASSRFPELVVACTDSDEVRAYDYDPDSGLLAEDTARSPLFAYDRPLELSFDFDETYLFVANDDPALPSLRVWCWVCGGIPPEESAYDAGPRAPLLFAGSGMGD